MVEAMAAAVAATAVVVAVEEVAADHEEVVAAAASADGKTDVKLFVDKEFMMLGSILVLFCPHFA